MPVKFSVVPASYVVLLRARRVLLARRAGTGWRDGWWSLPAGHVERDEPCTTAALRETAEEIGVEVTPADLEPLCAVHRTGTGLDPADERVDFFFRARTWSGEPTICEPDRCDGLDWFQLDELPHPIAPPVDRVLAGLDTRSLPPFFTHGFDDR